MSVDELVSKCKKGDHEAITLLYNLSVPKLKASAMRIVHNKQIVEDIVHDAFIIILTSLGSLKDNRSIAGWMNRIVVNLSYAYMKSEENRMVSLERLDTDAFYEKGALQSDEIPFEILEGMVDKLPEGYRKVFRLYVLEGLSHKEISELLHIEPHTSSSMLFVAKAKLQKMIVEYRSVAWLLPVIFLVIWYFFSKKNFETARKSENTVVKTNSRVPSGEKHKAVEQEWTHPVEKEYGIERKLRKPVLLAHTVPEKNSVPVDSVKKGSLRDTMEVAHDTVRTFLPLCPYSSSDKNDYASRNTNRTDDGTLGTNGWYFSLHCGLSGNQKMNNPTLPSYYSFQNTTSDVQPPLESFKDWESYSRYLNSQVIDGRRENDLKAIASHNRGSICQRKSLDMPFIMEAMADKALTKHWNVGFGVSYTRAGSEITTGENGYCTMERQKVRYIGIPLKGIYVLHPRSPFSVYVSGGVKMDIPCYAHNHIDYVINGKVDYRESVKVSVPLQWSVNAGMGIQYDITPSFGLFLEPGVSFYFRNNSKIHTIFNEHQTSFTLPFGIRIKY
jgi:RNA polymerase sigma-70 factor (ECF subfamily)